MPNWQLLADYGKNGECCAIAQRLIKRLRAWIPYALWPKAGNARVVYRAASANDPEGGQPCENIRPGYRRPRK
jgi:hypothetical protein